MNPFKVLIAASEVAPFAKTGGLADVSAGLGRALWNSGHDARLVMPLYRRLRAGPHELAPRAELQGLELEFGGRTFDWSVAVTRLPKSEVDVYLIDCSDL